MRGVRGLSPPIPLGLAGQTRSIQRHWPSDMLLRQPAGWSSRLLSAHAARSWFGKHPVRGASRQPIRLESRAAVRAMSTQVRANLW